jgi:hypothetical protein
VPKGVKTGQARKGTLAKDGLKRCGAKACRHGMDLQPVSNFAKTKLTNKYKDGLFTFCLTCRADYDNLRYYRNRDKEIARSNAYAQRDAAGFPGLRNHRRQKLSQTYGLTPTDYLALFNLQCGRCEICQSEFPTLWLNPIDHCHRTGRVCGLLCYSCNSAIGKLGESSEMIMRAAEYVRTRKEAG